MSRWHTLGWFSATLLLIWWLVWPSSQSSDDISRPNTVDAAGQGLVALRTWLQRSGVEVHSQRLRLSDLPAEIAGSTGNIAIVHLPGDLFYEAEEVQALLAWVARGNTLLVAASYLEGPDWAYTGLDIDRAMWRLSGLAVATFREPLDAIAEQQENDQENEKEDWQETFKDVVVEAQEDLEAVIENKPEPPIWQREQRADEVLELRSQTRHEFSDNLATLTVPWDAARWELVDREAQLEGLVARAEARAQKEDEEEEEDEVEEEPSTTLAVRTSSTWFNDLETCDNELASSRRSLLGKAGCLEIPTPAAADWQVLLAHPDNDQPALLSAPLEQGQVLVLWHPSLLANALVHRFDNRHFSVRLIDTYLDADGVVVFDDAHQGLNSIIQSADLLSDSRFYATVGFLLMFWVAYLLADAGQWQRASQRAGAVIVGQMDLIRANANFMRNRMSKGATRQLMLERLRDYLARKWQLRPADALEEGLALERDQHPSKVRVLEDSLEKLGRGGKVAPLLLQQQIDRLLHAHTETNIDTDQGED